MSVYRRLTALLGIRVKDPEVDRVLRNHEACLAELQKLPAAALAVKDDVELEDGKVTAVAHRLGRAPVLVLVSPARGGAATVEEVRSSDYDRTRTVALRAAVVGGGSVFVEVAVL